MSFNQFVDSNFVMKSEKSVRMLNIKPNTKRNPTIFELIPQEHSIHIQKGTSPSKYSFLMFS